MRSPEREWKAYLFLIYFLLLKKYTCEPGMVEHALSLSILKAEASRSLCVPGQPDLQNAFQDSQVYYTEKHCLGVCVRGARSPCSFKKKMSMSVGKRGVTERKQNNSG